MLDLIYFLLIGLAAGWLARKSHEGPTASGSVGNLVIGVIGAIAEAGFYSASWDLPPSACSET